LHPGDCTLLLDEAHDAREKVDVLVFPYPEIVRADAAVGGDGSRFGEHQRCAAYSAAPEVDQVPVVGESVGARVLAHGGNNNAIAEGYVANFQWVEQWHRSGLAEHDWIQRGRMRMRIVAPRRQSGSRQSFHA